jgi:hypothetical protein
MASGLAVGGDIEKALESVGVPSYVLDSTGVVRWMNAAAKQLLGDVRGRHFTSVVAPLLDPQVARELGIVAAHFGEERTKAPPRRRT